MHLDPGSLLFSQQSIEAQEVFLDVVCLDNNPYKHIGEQKAHNDDHQDVQDYKVGIVVTDAQEIHCNSIYRIVHEAHPALSSLKDEEGKHSSECVVEIERRCLPFAAIVETVPLISDQSLLLSIAKCSVK